MMRYVSCGPKRRSRNDIEAILWNPLPTLPPRLMLLRTPDTNSSLRIASPIIASLPLSLFHAIPYLCTYRRAAVFVSYIIASCLNNPLIYLLFDGSIAIPRPTTIASASVAFALTSAYAPLYHLSPPSGLAIAPLSPSRSPLAMLCSTISPDEACEQGG